MRTLGPRYALTSSATLNMRRAPGSRARLEAGDVFRVGLPDGTWVFGRVIAAGLSTEVSPGPGSNLVYVYRQRALSPTPPLAALTRDALLLPPLFIARLPWSRGYFRTVLHRPLMPGDVVDSPCFGPRRGDSAAAPGRCPEAEHPRCGQWAVQTLRSFDDMLSDALGLERAPRR